MHVLRIQHSVPDFDSWKRAFDADPMDRKGAGVRRYSIYRSTSDANFVIVDLQFDTGQEADRMLAGLRRLWAGEGAAVMRDPEAWVVEEVESGVL